MPYVFWLRVSRYLHRLQAVAGELSCWAFERAVEQMLTE
jgi:hypothetical protein